jgi:exodeoxyribonuclease V alpha subunit
VNLHHLWLGAALVSSGVGQGHVCTLLTDFAGQPIPGQETGLFPEIDVWVATLKGSPVVGAPLEFKPLILDPHHRLYLQRYWSYEWEFARTILSRATTINPALDEKLLKDGLQRLFGHNDSAGIDFHGQARGNLSSEHGEREGVAPTALPMEGATRAPGIDWQKVAALVAARSSLTVISGGPGTGKTFTVAKVLALILEQAKERRCTVALAAPTGKAAARLKGVITSAKSSLDCAEHIKAAIPEEASTIHRLLSPIGGSRRFRFNKDNHLPYDVVVVDETSMSDLPLMAKLGEALSPKAQLILLGDKDQLASVEPGAVFGDLCDTVKASDFSRPFRDFAKRVAGCDLHGAGEHTSPLADSVVVLTKNYRFSDESGIGKVSRLINSGKGEEALDLIQSGSSKDISWKSVPSLDRLPGKLESILIEHYSAYLKAAEPDTAFDLFNRFHILCALREGPFGAKAINQMIENVALKRRLIRREGRWYRGQPLMVVVNDYQLRLFNGDIGILLSDPDSGSLRVHFPTEEGMFRKILPGRLPAHEPAYALTVHKSQGSEFDHVLVILPDRYAEVVTRELIYTAITRARASVEIWGREEVFLQAMARQAQRVSGLRERLRLRTGKDKNG